MAEHAGSKILLVLPLDFRHSEKTVYELLAACARRKTCRALILFDVAPLKFSSPLPGHKPARDITERA